MTSPNTESPIEDIFEHAFLKFYEGGSTLERQREFQTRLGTFRVDFVLQHNDYLIGFECDGREFHLLADDEVRDAALLGENHLGTIYHLPGRELWLQPAYVIDFIGQRDDLFSPRVMAIAKTQIELDPVKPSLRMRRWSRVHTHTPRDFWPVIFRNMIDWGCTSIAEYREHERLIWNQKEAQQSAGANG